MSAFSKTRLRQPLCRAFFLSELGFSVGARRLVERFEWRNTPKHALARSRLIRTRRPVVPIPTYERGALVIDSIKPIRSNAIEFNLADLILRGRAKARRLEDEQWRNLWPSFETPTNRAP
jgi:hypothetical protein